MQPVTEKLIRYSDVGGRVFNPIQPRRDEPSVIDLPGNLSLDVLKRLLPNGIDTHKSQKFLYTGLFTSVDNLVFWDGLAELDKMVNTMSPHSLSRCVFDPILFPQDLANVYGVFPEEIPSLMLIHRLIFHLIKQYDRYYPHYSLHYSYSDSDS
jgi:hypothetical protein